MVEDTPLLINIKGCGYPPEVDCDAYAEKYHNHSMEGETFPCHYSRMNPWIVMSSYSREDNLTSVLWSILIPNGLFVLSLVVLVYWQEFTQLMTFTQITNMQVLSLLSGEMQKLQTARGHR